ncbi:TIM barrel protein [Pseudooctadecabacter jejudonensis]|nr:TIM barrel protein [Pseudooctadecabacter jejudonensis]
MAKSLGCAGVELRTDLEGQPFDGHGPTYADDAARQTDLKIFALAEMAAFNRDTAQRLGAATALMDQAVACGARGIALIPDVGDAPVTRAEQRRMLQTALAVLQPELNSRDLIGFIEPLGFANATLRHKDDVVQVLEDMGASACFELIHDTFHHCLAGDGTMYAKRTGMVHVSGVAANVPPAAMTDAHRVLVDADDRLGSIAQLRALAADGYRGPLSLESFAPEIHDLTDPEEALAGSIAFITRQLQADAAGAV